MFINTYISPVYLPVYFQATHLASAIQSGVDMFGTSFVVPVFAIGTGISVQVFKRYRPQNHLGWMLIVIGFGVLSLLDENTSKAKCIAYQVVLAAGIGIVWISTDFPILAPLPFSNNAHALGFMIFVRCSAQVSFVFACTHVHRLRLGFYRAGGSSSEEPSFRTVFDSAFHQF